MTGNNPSLPAPCILSVGRQQCGSAIGSVHVAHDGAQRPTPQDVVPKLGS